MTEPRKTLLMGMPGNFIETPGDLDLDPDAKPKVGQHVGADGGYEHPGEAFQMESGIWALEPGRLSAWIKLAGEPAETLYETPDELTRLWLDFVSDEGRPVLWLHTYTDGKAFAVFRTAIPHLWKVGITFQSVGPRPVQRSVWTGKCPCPRCIELPGLSV